MLDEIEEKRLSYYDFVDEHKDTIDTDGHGTHCTSLLLNYAPNAEIFAGRVFRTSEADDNSAAILAKVYHFQTSINKLQISDSLVGNTACC